MAQAQQRAKQARSLAKQRKRSFQICETSVQYRTTRVLCLRDTGVQLSFRMSARVGTWARGEHKRKKLHAARPTGCRSLVHARSHRYDGAAFPTAIQGEQRHVHTRERDKRTSLTTVLDVLRHSCRLTNGVCCQACFERKQGVRRPSSKQRFLLFSNLFSPQG